MLNKLIFLQHGGQIPTTQVSSNINPFIGLVVSIILVGLLIGLWTLFTKKKSI